MQQLDFRARPPSALPVPFFALGLAGLLAVPIAAVIDPAVALHDHPAAAGVLFLHLITLGFLAPVMLGAYYQLIPVVLHAPMPCPALGRWILAALAAGVLVFLAGWGVRFPDAIAAGGTLAGLALYAFIAQVGAALARLRRPTLPAAGFAGALLALAAVSLLGPLMALGFVTRALLVAHVSAALAGWLLLTILGATYQLVPFFAATPPAIGPRFGYGPIALVAAGTLLLAFGAGPVGGAAALLGVVLWAADMARLAGHGRQARREPVARYTALAIALLVLAAAGAEADLLGAAIPVRVLALAGLLSAPALLVMAQLQKILPFLAALEARGVKTEQLFSRQTADRVLPVAALGFLGLAAASTLASQIGVRAAAIVAAAAVVAYLAIQGRALRRFLSSAK